MLNSENMKEKLSDHLLFMQVFNFFYWQKKMEIKIQENLTQTNIKKKEIACNYGNKLVCVDEKLRKSFETYFERDAVFSFINSMIEESKYCR